MKKLTLHPHDLRIESFETHAPSTRGGTVLGAAVLTRVYEATCVPWQCYAPTELGYATYNGAGPCVRCAG